MRFSFLCLSGGYKYFFRTTLYITKHKIDIGSYDSERFSFWRIINFFHKFLLFRSLRDITYIWTSEGWLYLAVILDLYSRRIIGWAASNRMKRDLVIRALEMAVALRQPPKGCIHHTDRGSQYCSNDYQKVLKKHGFKVSMSGKGNCYDNAVVETFFKTLKAEQIWRNTWTTRRQTEMALFEYINGFYNPRRRHSTLGGKSPLAFERRAA